MHPEQGRPRYQAYLLRCWEVRPADDASATTWRFSLEDPHTGQHRHYSHLEALIAALQQELMGRSPPATPEGGPGGYPQPTPRRNASESE